MSENKQNLLLLKAIIKSELTNQEIKIVHYMLSKPVKTVSETITQIAKDLGIAQPNCQRAIKNLIKKNVVGERPNGHFVKAKTSWRSPEK